MLEQVAPKAFEKFTLLIAEKIKDCIDLLLVTDLFEKMVNIHHVFVRLLKITQQHFTPEIELVKRLALQRRIFGNDQPVVNLLESMDELEFIRNFRPGEFTDKFFDCS